jgi:uncharacterized damage-inducible protein DinB
MSPSIQLANRFREVMLDGTWVANTNYQQQLSDVNCQQAVAQIDSLNTIAALTFHINYYISGVLNVLRGGSLDIRDKYSYKMPAVTSDTDWENLKQTLLSNASQFAQAVEQLSDEKLNSVFVDSKYGTYHRNIDALIEHAYYHLGQITMLKKLIPVN